MSQNQLAAKIFLEIKDAHELPREQIQVIAEVSKLIEEERVRRLTDAKNLVAKLEKPGIDYPMCAEG